MKRFGVILLLLVLPVALQAQALGQVPCDARVFSTGFPASFRNFENDGPKMSEEKREIAIKCIEDTFGKIKEYHEYWGDCTGEHIFLVELESGDSISFYDGCLGDYIICSSRFSVGGDHLREGLRVGQKINENMSQGEWIIRQSDNNPGVYYFSPVRWDDAAYVIVDENGIIQSIHKITHDC